MVGEEVVFVLLVGLTGGIASGKTLVRGFFEELGARTIDADQVSRELTSPGSPAWDGIVSSFGRDILLPDGGLDRKKLADLIFANAGERARLEAILHPLIGDEIAARIQRFSAEDPQAVIVLDAALLIEVGRQEDFNRLVVVYADEETRLARLMARDGLSRHDAHRRILAQMPLEAKLEYADFVIDNSGSREETRKQAQRVFEELRTLP